MPPMTPVPTAFCAPEPAPRGERQRQHARHEGQRSHEDRAQALLGRVHHGFDQAHAVIEVLLGELDDEDGVLGREADGRQQADLEVRVVGEAARQASR